MAKKQEEFYNKLAFKESSNNPKAREKEHGNHYGLYQMGKAALDRVKYYNLKENKWTGKDNINSLEDFLNNPSVQKKAVVEYHDIVYKNQKFQNT